MGALTRRALEALTTRSADTGGLARALAGVLPPPRTPAGADARSLAAVYRAVQVLSTAAMQMPLTVERWGTRMDRTPSLIAQPDPRMPASQWVAHMVTSLALYGNAYAIAERDHADRVTALRVLDPRTVFLTVDPTNHRLRFHVEGADTPASDMLHTHLQPAVPGEPIGLGPIQAARADIDGAVAVRDYASQWFTGTGEPAGILSSPSATFEEALATRNAWNGLDPEGKPVTTPNPSRVKVLPAGFTYNHLQVNPRDAQWVEAQDFNTVQVGRLFGIPSSLMMANPSGGSTTYANVQDEWLQFVRFTLMAYLRPIEDALTGYTAGGQTVRFNLDALMRAGTKARYDAHAVALANGFLTIDEVRELEGRAPLTPQETTHE